MIELFHPGTKIPKSRCNAFDIPPKRAAKEPKPKVYKQRPSKVVQAARALETAEERAQRLANGSGAAL